MHRLPGIALVCLLATAAEAQPVRRDLGRLETIPLLRHGPEATETTSLSAFSGPLVIYFYGPDCTDCTEQLAWLQRLARQSNAARSYTVLAVAVELGAQRVARRPVDLGPVVALVDEGGRLWLQARSMAAVDAPVGARAKGSRVLPQTLYVGRWVVRHHGTTRLPLDKLVARRRMLINAVLFHPPSVDEIDIEDEYALQSQQWTPPRPDAGAR